VGSADLEVGMGWVQDRLGVAPIVGGVHQGFGTRNALLGLGYPYLEVLSLDPAQGDVSIPWNDRVRAMTSPALLSVAIGKTPLERPIPMSRLRADGFRLEWELEFTETPLFFIDWKAVPRPSGLPDAGRLTSLSVTTPDPDALAGVEDVIVREGAWSVSASINGAPLV
jgi:hypothetical protein